MIACFEGLNYDESLTICALQPVTIGVRTEYCDAALVSL